MGMGVLRQDISFIETALAGSPGVHRKAEMRRGGEQSLGLGH